MRAGSSASLRHYRECRPVSRPRAGVGRGGKAVPASPACAECAECDKLRPQAPFSPLARIRSRYRLLAATRSRFGPGLVHVRPYLVRPFVEGIARRLRRAQQLCNRSEEHTSELQSLMRNSYAVFCLKKKNI